MAKISLPSQQASSGFAITPSDTVDIAQDPGNTNGYGFCYVFISGASGAVKINTASGDTISVYGVQGNILGGNMPIQVSRVWATPTPPTCVALVGKGGSY